MRALLFGERPDDYGEVFLAALQVPPAPGAPGFDRLQALLAAAVTSDRNTGRPPAWHPLESDTPLNIDHLERHQALSVMTRLTTASADDLHAA